MFNQYFAAGEDSIEFLFAHLAVKNIDFAAVSLRCILEPRRIDYTLFQDEHTYYFFHIQSILTACDNLYNIFYGNFRWQRANDSVVANRPKLLRETFHIEAKSFPLVFNKAVRNTNEHFDERFDVFRWNVGDYNLLNNTMDAEMRETILNHYHLRTFDRDNGVYYTYVRGGKNGLRQAAVNFYELQKQLAAMRERIITHPIFESRWFDRMPGDILK